MKEEIKLLARYTTVSDKFSILYVIIAPIMLLLDSYTSYPREKHNVLFFILYPVVPSLSIFIIWLIIRDARRKREIERQDEK